jgi:hypothetical protein
MSTILAAKESNYTSRPISNQFKKMKKLKFIAFTLITILFCTGITACGDDDKNEPKNSDKTESYSIVGTWVGTAYDYHADEEYGIIANFDSDGSCYIISDGDYDYGTYIYADSRLTVSYNDGYKWRTTVTWNSNNKITLDDGEGERITLTRQ